MRKIFRANFQTHEDDICSFSGIFRCTFLLFSQLWSSKGNQKSYKSLEGCQKYSPRTNPKNWDEEKVTFSPKSNLYLFLSFRINFIFRSTTNGRSRSPDSRTEILRHAKNSTQQIFYEWYLCKSVLTFHIFHVVEIFRCQQAINMQYTKTSIKCYDHYNLDRNSINSLRQLQRV